jgi:TonB family protein
MNIRKNNSGPKIRLISQFRRKKAPRLTASSAVNVESADNTTITEMLDEYFKGEQAEDKRPTKYSLLMALALVFLSFYIVFPAFIDPLDISKKDQEVYIAAGGSAAPPPSRKKEQKRVVRKELIPNLYPELDTIELTIEDDVAEVSSEGDWDQISVDGRVGGVDFGTGEGGVGPYIKAGPGGKVPQPELVYRVEPIYPEAARRERADGFVLLQAIVNQKGNVVDVKVLQAPPARYGFAEKAIEAVTQWRFKPSYYKGNPVAVQIKFSVDFSLLY